MLRTKTMRLYHLKRFLAYKIARIGSCAIQWEQYALTVNPYQSMIALNAFLNRENAHGNNGFTNVIIAFAEIYSRIYGFLAVKCLKQKKSVGVFHIISRMEF